MELKLLTARRGDLVADRTRAVNRLRNLLTGIFPALERALDDFTATGQLRLLTGYQTPAPLRRIGAARLEAWLRNRKVRNPAKLAQIALAAAHQQRIQLPGEALTAQLIATIAEEVITLNEQIRVTDKLIEDRFHQHEHATVITSMPGIGTLLGLEFLAATGGDMRPSSALPTAWPASPAWRRHPSIRPHPRQRLVGTPARPTLLPPTTPLAA